MAGKSIGSIFAWSRDQTLAVGLLFLFSLINYLDKLVLGIVALPMRAELGISASQFGLIGSAFFIFFSAAGIIVGFFADRMPSKTILAIMVCVWSLTQLPILLAPSFAVILVCRVMLGAAEGPSAPVATHALYKWFKDEERTLPSSIVTFGAAAGFFLGAPLLTWVSLQYGWRAPFLVVALLGFAWTAIWLLFGKEGHDPHHGDPARPESASLPPAWRGSWRIFRNPTFWGLCVCGFASYWCSALLLVWVPTFLVQAQGLSPATAAGIISLSAAVMAAISIIGSALSQLAQQRGADSRRARAIPIGVALLVGAAAFVLAGLSGRGAIPIAALLTAIAAVVIVFPLGFAIVGEISTPAYRASSLAIFSGVATLAGIVGPYVMGRIVDLAPDPGAGFEYGFLVSAVLMGVSGVIGLIVMHPRPAAALPAPEHAAPPG